MHVYMHYSILASCNGSLEMRHFRTVGPVAVTLVLAACATPSVSPSITVHEKRAATVAYGDLEPATPEGGRELRDRVATAASLVCRPESGADPFAGYRRRSCIDAIVENFETKARSNGLASGKKPAYAIEVNDTRDP
jgi:UrcA family protein